MRSLQWYKRGAAYRSHLRKICVNLCKSVGEHLSRVKSVGFFLHHTSVNSVNSVGGLAEGGVGGVSKLPYSKKITKP